MVNNHRQIRVATDTTRATIFMEDSQKSVFRNLYALGFDPLLKESERFMRKGQPFSLDVEEELDLKGAVGVDATHSRGGKHDVRGPLLLEERAHGGGVLQLQLRVCASDDPPVRKPRVVPQQRAASQPSMPCDINGFVSHARALQRPRVKGGRRKARVLLCPVPPQVKRFGVCESSRPQIVPMRAPPDGVAVRVPRSSPTTSAG